MPSSGMLHRVALVRTDIYVESIVSIIRIEIIRELETTLVLTSNRCIVFLRSVLWFLVTVNVVPSSQIIITVMMKTKHCSVTSDLTRATRRNILDESTVYNSKSFEIPTLIRPSKRTREIGLGGGLFRRQMLARRQLCSYLSHCRSCVASHGPE
jgi:hypothetical protein